MAQMHLLISNPIQLLSSIAVLILLGFPISRFLKAISKNIDIPAPEGVDKKVWDKLVRIPGPYGGKWIGTLERILFFTTILGGVPELIIAWLAFKVASKWEVWNNLFRVPEGLEGASDLHYFLSRTRWGTRTLQRFLVGTLLNLLAAFAVVALFLSLIDL